MDPNDVALSFKQVGISSLLPPRTLLANVSGYVKRGGITAIMGASASGKSVLMKTLAGRMQKMHMSGEITLDGVPMDHNDLSNGVSYVPQDDFLMGELSARETLTNIASMKTGLPAETIDADVDELLKSFGLGHVADNAIGTVFKRGLSGGQRKRVEVCSELIAPHSVIFLDEPTSGLDGAIAYDVLSATKKILESKNKTLSLIISIHQPNSRILELFDHVLLLGGGGSLFFGTVADSVEYFSSIGFPPPPKYTPTDVYLQVSDSNFGENQDFDFEGSFACSLYASSLETLLDSVTRAGMMRALSSVDNQVSDVDQRSTSSIKPIFNQAITAPIVAPDTTFWRQYTTLVKRDFTIAYRDPSLYYLQFVLVSFFGFLVGACFYSTSNTIDKSSNVSGGLLWIVMMMCYIQVFKVYHLSRSDQRVRHEISNNTYYVLAFWLSELTSTMILLLSFLPGTIIAYFMMELPNKAYPFLLFLYWLTALTAETMLNFITKFSSDATVSIVTCQAFLVVLTVFGGGMFIAWDKCPDYWKWLQELSLFTQASRAAIMSVADELNYDCSLNSYGMCMDSLGHVFTCITGTVTSNSCSVWGRDVLSTLQGTLVNESKWIPFGYLVLIFSCLRLAVLFLMIYPVEKLKFMFDNWLKGTVMRGILDTKIALRRMQGQLSAYIALKNTQEVRGAWVNSGSGKKTSLTVTNEKDGKVEEFVEVDYSSDEELIANGPCLVWNNLSVILKGKGTKLVDNVSGVAFPGRILALMGPSGAGKTTLLNALSNRAPYAKLVGDVAFGKRPFTSSDLVYVPQFDEFNQNLTVFETIELVGLLKCKDANAMRLRLGNLVSILGLAPKVHTLCKDLTSGELKRVSVGMGMISNPNVLFLDEPTTGLDSSAAYSIVKYLSQLSAATNVVVIMTIHQPAQIVFDMLQDLYLLESGRLAFFGPSSATQNFFAANAFIPPTGINPVDFYLDLVSKPPPTENKTWSDIYYESPLSKNYGIIVKKTVNTSEAAGNPPESPAHLNRLATLMGFFFKYYTRDIGFYYLRLAFLVIIALFIGTLFLQLTTNTNNLTKYSGAIFFNIWATLFSAVAATGLMAADRRQASEQVKNAIITPSVYCFAQFAVSLPFNFVIALIYQCIFHWLININPRGESFIYAVLITCGHLLLMEGIMLTVVAVLKNSMLSVTFAMVVLGYLFLFSGFFIVIKDMPKAISWVSYITPTRYSFVGYLWQVYSTQDFDISGYPQMPKLTGKTFLDVGYDLRDIDSWAMFGVLLAWTALFRFAHYAAFLYEVYPFLHSVSTKPKATKIEETGVELA